MPLLKFSEIIKPDGHTTYEDTTEQFKILSSLNPTWIVWFQCSKLIRILTTWYLNEFTSFQIYLRNISHSADIISIILQSFKQLTFSAYLNAIFQGDLIELVSNGQSSNFHIGSQTINSAQYHLQNQQLCFRFGSCFNVHISNMYLFYNNLWNIIYRKNLRMKR